MVMSPTLQHYTPDLVNLLPPLYLNFRERIPVVQCSDDEGVQVCLVLVLVLQYYAQVFKFYSLSCRLILPKHFLQAGEEL